MRKGKYADFIPSSRDLAGAELEIANAKNRDYVLKTALDHVKDKYDFVFIDCAPSINLTLINALSASDGVIVPLQCEYFALEGLNQLLNTVRLVKSTRTRVCGCTESFLRCSDRPNFRGKSSRTCGKRSKTRFLKRLYLKTFALPNRRVSDNR